MNESKQEWFARKSIDKGRFEDKSEKLHGCNVDVKRLKPCSNMFRTDGKQYTVNGPDPSPKSMERRAATFHGSAWNCWSPVLSPWTFLKVIS